ncbi:paeninodin family lasso peptide [Lachnospira multipara]|nr:paeninodin family lasso peptide [Lachnospira multipara]
MRTWTTPELEVLEITETAQGKVIKATFDAIRTDENGNLWVSFPSGAED